MSFTPTATYSSYASVSVTPLSGALLDNQDPNILTDHFVPTIALVLLLISISFVIGHHLKANHSKYISETAASVMLGMLSGIVAINIFNAAINVQLSSSFFYLVLLPPIIFEAGYSMKRVNFFKNFNTIMALAFLGTVLSTFIIAIMIFLLAEWLAPDLQFSFLDAMTYGALISATDPVSVLATLSEVPVDKNVYICIFGESALNDAVAIIIYDVMKNFAETSAEMTAGTVFNAIFSAIGIFVASILLGYIIGMILAKFLKHANMKGEHVTEAAFVYIFAYMSYLIAEYIKLSPIVAVLFCGMAMAHYVIDNLSEEAVKLSKDFVRIYAFISETIIFVYLGLGKKLTYYRPDFIAISFFSMLFSRVHVFLICGVANIFRKQNKFTFKQQLFFWFAGLRGALCFVMALELSDNEAYNETSRRVILSTTLITVFLTIIVMGAFTISVIDGLNLRVEDEPEEEKKKIVEKPHTETQGFSLKGIDKRYIKPFLTNKEFGMERIKEDASIGNNADEIQMSNRVNAE